MNIAKAINTCKEGHFITNNLFGSEQSIHFYNGKIYQEDGTVLDQFLLAALGHRSTNCDWFIKYNKDHVNQKTLKEYHIMYEKDPIKFTIDSKSFEDCIDK